MLLRLARAMLGAGTTALAGDCREYIAAARPAPVLEGAEGIPPEGSFCAIANHHERRGLWIGLPSCVLIDATARRRPGEPPLHMAVIDETRLWRGRLPVPGTRWAYGRVAGCYGMVTLPARGSDVRGRARALLTLARLALPPPRGRGEAICLFPEGEHGTATGMGDALPGTGSFLLLLAAAGVPTLPVGIAEAGGRLRVRVGSPEPLTIDPSTPRDRRDRAARTEAMRRIAALVPPTSAKPGAET